MTEALKNKNETEPSITHYYVLTDADGSLLRHSDYSFADASQGITLAKERGVPIHIISSKTAAEIKLLQQDIGIFRQSPFTAENGGASYYPEGFLNFDIKTAFPEYETEARDGFIVIRFGRPYSEVREVLREAAAETSLSVTGIGDMSDEEFAAYTGLSLDKARLARQREYQEGFVINASESEQIAAQARMRDSLVQKGMEFSHGGRFCQVFAGGSKAKAADIAIKLYRRNYQGEKVVSIGIGDAPNDLEFLELCDQGYLVGNPNKIIGAEVESAKVYRIPEIGPIGWNRVVLAVLQGQSDAIMQQA